MTHNVALKRPFGALFSRVHAQHDSREALQEMAQLALQIEFATIPVYLTAMYSISQTDSLAYQTLRSVVMEEMFHLNQAANLLVAIGGLPRLTGEAAPTYPGYLPHANPDTTPYIGLFRASTNAFENVFAAIETPAPAHAPAQGDNYDTIAQVYEALVDGLKRYNGREPLFTPNPKGRQRTDIYLGKFGGKPIDVNNLEQAEFGVQQIVKQGEGAAPEAQSYVPLQPFATYNHYGKRTDGTYGPIIGTPYEMSHFKKFRTVALDVANFPATYPILSNPQREDFHNPLAIKAAQQFDVAYSVLLLALEQSFQKQKPGMPDPFFAVALPLMHEVMPALARTLMNTPTRSDGDNSVGPNAAPTFVYQPGCSLQQIPASLRELIHQARATLTEGNDVSEELDLLADALESATTMVEACPNFQ